MTTLRDRALSGRPDSAQPLGQSVPSSDGAARDDAVALLKLAGLDDNVNRLRETIAAIVQQLESQRRELAALAELIEIDLWTTPRLESDEILEAKRRRRLLSNQRLRAAFEKALKRDEADVLAMSCLLQRKTASLAEERHAALARVSAPLRERYEAAAQQGLHPVVNAACDGRCPGCGEALPGTSRRQVEESLCMVRCTGCFRLLYESRWTERNLMPPPPRPVAGAKP